MAKSPYKKPPNPQRSSNRPPRERREAIFGKGPRLFQRGNKDVHTGGPGIPPPGFLTATTSVDEWLVYWALMRILDPTRDPRQPPFYGGQDWQYQSAELGTYSRELGSAVVDFLITLSFPFIVFRIQTFRFHLATDAKKQAHDKIQLNNLSNKFLVVDLYSQDFLSDETGQAAIVVVKEALGLIRRQDPLSAGGVLNMRAGRNF